MTTGPGSGDQDETQPYGWQPPVPYPPPPPPAPYPSGASAPPPTQPYGTPYLPQGPWPQTPYSDKSRTTAGLLQLLLPFVFVCGVGRLYSGHVAIGLVQLIGYFAGLILATIFIGFLIFPPIWLWSVIDGIVILSSQSRDGQGRLLR